VDERVIENIRDGVGRIIDSQKEVGGWDPYPEERRPVGWDTDGDGMPDAWENANGLDPQDPEDRNGDRDGDGYTKLEDYLNSLVPDMTGLMRNLRRQSYIDGAKAHSHGELEVGGSRHRL
jgi:hypothetical protein